MVQSASCAAHAVLVVYLALRLAWGRQDRQLALSHGDDLLLYQPDLAQGCTVTAFSTGCCAPSGLPPSPAAGPQHACAASTLLVQHLTRCSYLCIVAIRQSSCLPGSDLCRAGKEVMAGEDPCGSKGI